MKPLKHLPVDQWPAADLAAFEAAYTPGDIFDDLRGPGAHLTEGTRRMIRVFYARWLTFLNDAHPEACADQPADRITRERVRGFIESLKA